MKAFVGHEKISARVENGLSTVQELIATAVGAVARLLW